LNYTAGQLFQTLVEQNGSDLHIAVGSPPRVRIDGQLVPLQLPPIEPAKAGEICYTVMNEEQRKIFEQNNEIDFSFEIKNLARFRANIYVSSGNVAGAFRLVPSKIFSIDELGLPKIVKTVCDATKGLVLVTGATGSGKSTTLAAMVDYINSNRYDHIITLEDPVEFVHTHKKCLIHQREVGSDSSSFKVALKSILRQDPDIVLLGELRDRNSIGSAITIAETGHIVLATLHTNSCVDSVNRIVDSFPGDEQSQIRAQLSASLKAVFSQQLIPAVPNGRALALEIMMVTSGIRSLILEGKTNQIYSQLQIGQAETGMQTMNQSLAKLAVSGQISKKDAMKYSSDVDELQNYIAKYGSIS